MKWNRFCKLKEKHPFVSIDLRHEKNISHSTKEFVKKKVGFIAFRPFDSLDLSRKCSLICIPPTIDPSECCRSVEYHMRFHIEGEDDGIRLWFVGNHIGDGSIQANIDHVTNALELKGELRGKQLVWERVVKYIFSGSSHAGITVLNLEIYQFPRFYRFRPIPRTPSRPVNPSVIAYMTGGPMPPIIPGTTKFVGDFD